MVYSFRNPLFCKTTWLVFSSLPCFISLLVPGTGGGGGQVVVVHFTFWSLLHTWDPLPLPPAMNMHSFSPSLPKMEWTVVVWTQSGIPFTHTWNPSLFPCPSPYLPKQMECLTTTNLGSFHATLYTCPLHTQNGINKSSGTPSYLDLVSFFCLAVCSTRLFGFFIIFAFFQVFRVPNLGLWSSPLPLYTHTTKTSPSATYQFRPVSLEEEGGGRRRKRKGGDLISGRFLIFLIFYTCWTVSVSFCHTHFWKLKSLVFLSIIPVGISSRFLHLWGGSGLFAHFLCLFGSTYSGWFLKLLFLRFGWRIFPGSGLVVLWDDLGSVKANILGVN